MRSKMQERMARWRGRDAEARIPERADLREGRPPAPEAIEMIDSSGLECMRCGEETRADKMTCLGEDYWLCPACAAFHANLRARTCDGGRR
jgi:formylmethanofuran dehydrogenase subunit E